LSWKTFRVGVTKPDGRIRFFLEKNGGGVSKLAFVGDEKWKIGFFMFTGKPMPQMAIEFFPQDQFEQAQAWISEKNLPVR
jgi:hypothetical protein